MLKIYEWMEGNSSNVQTYLLLNGSQKSNPVKEKEICKNGIYLKVKITIIFLDLCLVV